MDTWSLPPEQRTWASSGRLSRSALSSTAPTRPTTPLSRQSRRISRRMRLPSSGAMPHACMAATSAPADAPATGVSGVMSPRSRRTCHAPTWYGKIMPAAENPTPSTAMAFSPVDDDVAALGGARVTRTARRSTTPRVRVRGTRLCARDETAFGAVGAGETLMFWKRAPHHGAVCAAKWRERRWPLVLPRCAEGLSPHDQGTDLLHRTDLMAQLHTGTVMRAMFAGGIALWSKAATIAKVRTSPAPRTPRRGWHPLRFCDPAPLTAVPSP